MATIYSDTFTLIVVGEGAKLAARIYVPQEYESQTRQIGKLYSTPFIYTSGIPSVSQTDPFTISWQLDGTATGPSQTPTATITPRFPNVTADANELQSGVVRGRMPNQSGSYTATISMEQPA